MLFHRFCVAFVIISQLLTALCVTPDCYALDTEPPSQFLIEKPPFVTSATAVLSVALRSSPELFTVRDRVLSDGFLNEYVLVTKDGRSTLHGTSLLGERVYELQQLKELQGMSTPRVVLEATGKAGLDVLTAPARAVGALISAVRDPEGTWDTVKQVPSGVVGLFEYAGEQTSKVLSSTKKAIVGKSKKEKKLARETLANQATDESERFALKWAGYSSAEKQWYAKLGVDPYTDTEPLRVEIKRVAGAESAVNIAFKFVPGVGGLAYVGDANRVLKYSRQLAAFADPKELRDENRRKLKEAHYGAAAIETFLKGSKLSPTLQTALVESVLSLGKIKGSDGFLTEIGSAKTKETAVLLLESVNYLSILHKVKPISKFLSGYGVPVALLDDGTAVMPLPADTVHYTPAFASAWERLLQNVNAAGITAIEVRLRGAASPALRAALDKDGIFLFENVSM